MYSFSRARFLVASGLGVGGAALFDRLTAQAATANSGDIATLNAAIELERAGIKAYTDAASTNLLSPGILKVALLFRADHTCHLAALSAAVASAGGAITSRTAKLDYPNLASEKDILAFARTVEEKAASTYLSVIPDFKDRKLAGIAASILGVETVHVGILAQALSDFPPYPSGFAT